MKAGSGKNLARVQQRVKAESGRESAKEKGLCVCALLCACVCLCVYVRACVYGYVCVSVCVRMHLRVHV